jgi:surface antigen
LKVPKTGRKVKNISKLIEFISKSLFNREKLKNLANRIYRIQRSIARFIKAHRTIKVLHLFRNYSALVVVISSVFLVSATNFAAGRESSGFLFGYFGTNESYDNPLKDKFFLKSSKKTDVALAPLSEARRAPDPTAQNNDDNSLVTQGQALVAGTSPVKKDPEEDGGVIIYEVRSGDSVSAIAAKYSITVNTILWSNEMDNVDQIMPGDKIFILPISGLNYVIQKGDDIDSIAKKFKSDRDKIIAFNTLPANGELKEGEQITIPGGQKDVPRAAHPSSSASQSTGAFGIAERPYSSFTPSGKLLSGSGGSGHSFPYGYCTWYVAQRKYIPWSGNAGAWLYNAKSMGYATGKTPRVGAIMVSSESWWGHVGIVESVSGSTFTVSEMNYKAWAKKDIRTIAIGERVIRGFIYAN